MADRSQSIDLKVGESMRVGSATVTLLEKSGQRAKLRVTADDTVKVHRMVEQQATSQAARGVILTGG